MKRNHFLGSALLIFALLFSSCRSAMYSAWETFGVQKRDLLKKAVMAARTDQKEASEQFKDSLTRLKELYGFEGGDLEKTYNALKSNYDRSNSKADAVRKRIKEVETVSSDLFSEWEKEIKQISSAELKSSSRRQLSETRDRYEELHAALKKAEKSMEPVLTQFRDQVLYLKHNLNAEAIGSLKGETARIQTEISKLIAEMNESIAQSDKFIKALPQ
ncbi:MAG: DUF2959 domain-containing protein [Verrucomicrobiota bacterium]|nr:DUF2959 domain-containing protein [Verrucomicrobiota bacterium]